MSDIPKFSFTLFRFTGPKGQRSTETVRDLSIVHGMRAMVDHESITSCRQRVTDWAEAKDIGLTAIDPFPSNRYPGKYWLEFRFTGLVL